MGHRMWIQATITKICLINLYMNDVSLLSTAQLFIKGTDYF